LSSKRVFDRTGFVVKARTQQGQFNLRRKGLGMTLKGKRSEISEASTPTHRCLIFAHTRLTPSTMRSHSQTSETTEPAADLVPYFSVAPGDSPWRRCITATVCLACIGSRMFSWGSEDPTRIAVYLAGRQALFGRRIDRWAMGRRAGFLTKPKTSSSPSIEGLKKARARVESSAPRAAAAGGDRPARGDRAEQEPGISGPPARIGRRVPLRKRPVRRRLT